MKTKALAYLFLIIGGGLGVTALASRPVLPPLNPPAPPYDTCDATGSGAICRGQRVDTLDQVPSGILCGTAQNPVELLFSGSDAFRFTRSYDSDGNFTRQLTQEDFQGTILNPVTGLTAKLTELINFKDTAAVPGNLDTITEQTTGSIKISLRGGGVLLLDAGRVVFDPEGNVVSQSGHLALQNYFEGNLSEAAKLCSALGTPGTP